MHALPPPRYTLRRLSLIVGICLIPVLCGSLVIVQQIDRTLDVTARATALRTLYVVDRVFDAVREASNTALHNNARQCAGASPQLVTIVQANPLLHALSLRQADGSLCGSNLRELPSAATFERLGEQRVTLATPAATAAHDSLLTFAWHTDAHTLLATVQGQALHRRLSQFANGEVVQLDFVDHSIWITRDGYDHRHDSLTLNRVSKLSAQYGYTVQVGYTPGTFRRMFWQYSLDALPLLTLVGLLTGAGAYPLMLRHRRKALQVPS